MKILLTFVVPVLVAFTLVQAGVSTPSLDFASVAPKRQTVMLTPTTSPANLTECQTPAYNNCSFYAVCLESQFHCGPTGYPIGYGQYYCTKFQNESSLFDAAGVTWMENTMHCLQEALVPIAQNDAGNVTCASLKTTAFSTHAPCYVKEGLCTLSPQDWVAIFEVVGVSALISNWDAFKASIEAASDCAEFFAWMVVHEFF